jgi:outer membrane lipoprotein-sorting protein
MSRKSVANVVLFVSWMAGAGWAGACAESCEAQQKAPKTNPVDAILEKLNKTTSELTSFQCQIEYKYSQPLLESERLSKGTLYYSRSGGTSALRINFSTLKQEDEKERKYIEQYIILDGAKLTHAGRQFKGIWLVQLDYQIEEAKFYQLAEPNDPNDSPDVFDLVGRELPMLGFSRIGDLKKQFEVTLVEQKRSPSEDFTQVHLDVKPNSIYKDDFVSIDFWIDKKLGLPAKIVAVKTEPEPPFGDVEEIVLLKPKVNKGIDRSVFEFKIPRSFGEPEITPLPKKDKRQ